MFSGHMAYVGAAYLISAIVIGGLITWVVADLRAQRRALQELEQRGVRRRSAAKDRA